MSNRTAIIASAAAAGFVSIFSITSLTAQTAAAPDSKETAAAQDQCLPGPKATTPPGGHWYYRFEKGTKRKCWYLGDAGGKVNKPAALKPAPVADTSSEDDPSPPPKKPMHKSIANARAELRTGAPDEDPSLAETTWPPLASTADAAARQENSHQDNLRQDNLRDHQAAAIQPAPTPAATQGWNIASRWPEPKAVASADEPPPAHEPAQPQSAPTLTPDRLAAAAVTTGAATTAAPAATPAATAPTNATETSDGEMFSIRILLALLVCVLALAAIIGPMIFKYVRPRPRNEQRASRQRRPIWDMDITRETIRQDNPRVDSPALYADPLPEPRVLDEAVDELESLLARAARRSAA